MSEFNFGQCFFQSHLVQFNCTLYPQLIFPDLVEGLVLLNIDPNGKGWIDWAATKLSGLTSALPDTVLAHLFSQVQIMFHYG